MADYTISWRTTVVEYHSITVPFGELPEVLRDAIKTAGTLTHNDDQEILEFVSIDEGSSSLTHEDIDSRIITGITKEYA